MVVAGAGCSSKVTDAPPPTISPARAADSPSVTAPPAGEVRPLNGPGQATVFDRATHTLVVLGGSDSHDVSPAG